VFTEKLPALVCDVRQRLRCRQSTLGSDSSSSVWRRNDRILERVTMLYRVGASILYFKSAI
jgi:hypothetical protein